MLIFKFLNERFTKLLLRSSRSAARLLSKVRDYWILTKPRIWGLLVFTGFVAMLVAVKETGTSFTVLDYLIGIAALTLGSAAANTLTNYHDRDIDAVMERTKLRPIPSGRIKPRNALVFGLIMAVLSVILSLFFNVLSAIFMFAGLFDNIVVYSLLLKRRSWTNIILGGVSGGMPVLVGYAYVANTVSLLAIYMAALVIIWIPTHIWSLAIAYKEDYEKAGVPMLPVVFGKKIATVCIAFSSVLLSLISIVVIFFTPVTVVYLVTSAALAFFVIAYSIKLLIDKSETTAWKLFKLTSPYLMLIFVAFAVNSWL